MTAASADDRLADLIRSNRSLFPDLEFLAPGGVLLIGADQAAVELIRVELPAGQFLHLQSLGLDSNLDDLAALTSVEVSSWHQAYGERFELDRLLDFDHPTGTAVHTGADDPAWLEVRFSRPVDICRIRLRNVGDATAVRAQGIRVFAGSGGEWSVLYDQQRRTWLLDQVLADWVRQTAAPEGNELHPLVPILGLTMTGRYQEARRAFDALPLPDELRKHFRTVVTSELLVSRSLEWTVHGPQRCFRFWNHDEKVTYIKFTAEVVEALADLTPNVCFGFGAALSVVRDGDLIPHDDDLDLIIGFDPEEAATLPAGLRRVEAFLRPRGFTVAGNFSAHRHVSRGGKKHIDVFVGLFEGDVISWYPGKRGNLTRQMMFPTSEGSLYGVSVRLPRSPLLYLEQVYGPGWRHPDPNFKHTWDRSAYADLVKRGVSLKS